MMMIKITGISKIKFLMLLPFFDVVSLILVRIKKKKKMKTEKLLKNFLNNIQK